MWGIDCPEKNQDFGTKAKHITSILVFAKTVDVEPVTTDRYGRTVALALVRAGDTVVNEELLRQGPARVFTRHSNQPICEQRGGASGLCPMRYRHGGFEEAGDDASHCALLSPTPMTGQ